jgi:hypothetical protein
VDVFLSVSFIQESTTARRSRYAIADRRAYGIAASAGCRCSVLDVDTERHD